MFLLQYEEEGEEEVSNLLTLIKYLTEWSIDVKSTLMIDTSETQYRVYSAYHNP